METLKRHLPISGPEGLVELRKIAVRFEEKIYAAATSQVHYHLNDLFISKSCFLLLVSPTYELFSFLFPCSCPAVLITLYANNKILMHLKSLSSIESPLICMSTSMTV